MSDELGGRPKPRPHLTDAALIAQEERRERSARALRDNLKRRKQQLRSRAAEDAPQTKETPDADHA